MTVYYSDKVLATGFNAPSANHGPANVATLIKATAAAPVTLATTDELDMCYLPPNFVVTSCILKADQLDSNGSPTLTLNVGIAGTAGLFFSASTVGQTATASNAIAATGIGYKNGATKTLVKVVPNANGATKVAGNVTVIIGGFIEDSATSPT